MRLKSAPDEFSVKESLHPFDPRIEPMTGSFPLFLCVGMAPFGPGNKLITKDPHLHVANSSFVHKITPD